MVPATDLALRRTLLAHERTLMAWIRTSTSLISFGFTIYKFFDYLLRIEATPSLSPFGPRQFAIVMISVGVVTLAFATYDHRRTVKLLERELGRTYPSLAEKLAFIVSILGLGLLAVVLLQV